MAHLLLAEVPNGLAMLCVFAALGIGMLCGIFLMCALHLGKGADHGP